MAYTLKESAIMLIADVRSVEIDEDYPRNALAIKVALNSGANQDWAARELHRTIYDAVPAGIEYILIVDGCIYETDYANPPALRPGHTRQIQGNKFVQEPYKLIPEEFRILRDKLATRLDVPYRVACELLDLTELELNRDTAPEVERRCRVALAALRGKV